jgi:ATP-dependent helicase/nuclease subunit B
MSFFLLPAEQNYLDSTAKWLVEHFADDLANVRIFLPNGLMCYFLNHYISQHIKNKSHSTYFFLPTLIPISNICDNLFGLKLNSTTYSQASMLEQLFALAAIISAKENISFDSALDNARSLNQIFEEFGDSQIDMAKITTQDFSNKSLYLQQQIDLLSFYWQASRNLLAQHQKLTNYDFTRHALEEYSTSTSVFIASNKDSKALHKFIAKNLANPQSAFILPPLDIENIELHHSSANLLKNLQIPLTKIKKAQASHSSAKIDLGHFTGSKINKKADLSHISYTQCNNQIEESSLILILLKDFIDQNPNSTAAIVCPNYYLSTLISNNLAKHGLSFTNFIGQRFIESQLAQFLLSIARYLQDPENIQLLLMLLNHPYLLSQNLFSQNSNKLQEIIRAHKFISTTEQISARIPSQDSDLNQWWGQFLLIFNQHQMLFRQDKIGLCDAYMAILNIAEALYEQIWHLEHEQSAIEFLRSLRQNLEIAGQIQPSNFATLLKNLFENAMLKKPIKQNYIYLLSPENALYLNFDFVILSDMNEGSWPKMPGSGSLLTNQMRSDLGLITVEQMWQQKMCDFVVLLNNAKVAITRSIKTINATNTPSKFLHQLLAIASQRGAKPLADAKAYLQLTRVHLSQKLTKAQETKFFVPQEAFPQSISATSVELLIRNPYGFFARNILKLYKTKELSSDSINAEFGTLVHKIIYIFNSSQGQDFLEIAKAEFAEIGISNYLYSLWWPKICAIADKYNHFHRQRKVSIEKIYGEIAGSMTLEIAGKRQKISAIADEIVLLDDGQIQILDYKTGTTPLLSEVEAGLAPQLILEALILQHCGFKIDQALDLILPDALIRPSFIKITSNKEPIKKIKLENLELAKHKDGLIKLLQHYLSHPASHFPATPDIRYAPKFNDWRHLARR